MSDRGSMSGVRIAALVGAVALFAAGCRGDGAPTDQATPAAPEVQEDDAVPRGAPPSTEDLVGVWYLETGAAPGAVRVIRLRADGTFGLGGEGSLRRPSFPGRYEIDGRSIHFREDQPGRNYGWEAGVLEDGRLQAVVVYDHTGTVAAGTEWTFVRVSPPSPAGVGITAETDATGPPPSDALEVLGIWLLEGTGHLLEVGRDGTYALDDGGELGDDPDDTGTFEVDGKGTLTLTSGAESRTCPEGDTWAWKDVGLTFGAGVLVGAVSEDDCGRDLGDDLTWIRVSR